LVDSNGHELAIVLVLSATYSDPMTRRVQIIGGGIAGAALAIALRRVGIEAAVYEMSPAPAGKKRLPDGSAEGFAI